MFAYVFEIFIENLLSIVNLKVQIVLAILLAVLFERICLFLFYIRKQLFQKKSSNCNQDKQNFNYHLLYDSSQQLIKEISQQQIVLYFGGQTINLALSLYNTHMSQNIHQIFYEYILKHEPHTQSSHKELTVDRVFHLFLNKIQLQHHQKSIFSQQFFKGVLKKIAQIIMNTVYKHQLPFVKLQQIVTVVAVVQHITYSKSFDLPKPITERLTKYIHSLIVLESLQTMRTIFQDSRNSHALNNYYGQVYKSAYLHRVERISSIYGLKITSSQLLLYLLKSIIEQKDGEIQKYQSTITSQWITLSFIYLTLCVKADFNKQKPVLARVLRRYTQLPLQYECKRQINGDQLCDFYNSVFLGVVSKIDEKEFQSFMDQIKIDIDVIGQYVVNPIHNENNTVLDNLIFTPSWEP